MSSIWAASSITCTTLKPLQLVFDLTQDYAVIETALDLQNVDRPAISFVRGTSMPRPDVPLSNDSTNFFGPNDLAVVAMLEHVGFSRIDKEVVDPGEGRAPRGYFFAWK